MWRKVAIISALLAAAACVPVLLTQTPTPTVTNAQAARLLRVEVFVGNPDLDSKVVDAEVAFNGVVGKTDGAGNVELAVAAGTYPLTVRAQGYAPYTQSVSIDVRQFAQVVKVSLQRAKPVRSGRVRLEGRSMADDRGASLFVGTSLFWAVRDANSEHLANNLRFISEQGVDFIRVMAETSDWPEETRTDPKWQDYAERLRRVRDLAWSYGLRVEWTLFGGNKLSSEEQFRVLGTVLEICDQRPETVQFIEISNESNGFTDGDTRMRRFAMTVAEHGYVVALTSAAHARELLYAGSAANIATEHFDRSMREFGWRPVRQPWGYWERQNVPPAFVNNEPIGIGSSVEADTDPLRLTMGAIITWVSGGAAHVVHTGSGIYGVPTTHPVGGARPANLWEQPALEPTLKGIAAARSLLPRNLSSWSRQNHYWNGHPFVFGGDVGDIAIERKRGVVRGYGAVDGDNFVVSLTGIMGDIMLTPKFPMQWKAYNPLTGQVVAEGAGQFTFKESEVGRAVIIVGSRLK